MSRIVSSSRALRRAPPCAPRARQTSSTAGAARSSPVLAAALAAAALGTTALLFAVPSKELRAEAKRGYESQSQLHGGKVGTIHPGLFIWGQNEFNMAPGLPEMDYVKRAKLVIDDIVLRDLVLHQKYGVAVNDKGDVMQWGLGFTDIEAALHGVDKTAPHATLVGKDILKVAASDSKIFALSRKGEIYIFPVGLARQKIGADQRAGKSAWWKLRVIGGESDAGTDCEVLKTDVPMLKGEKFVSFSAGEDHLVALTSEGRAFAHPLSLLANAYGQLGVKKVALLSLHSSAVESGEKIVTLIPDPTINDIRRDIGPPAKLDPLLLNLDGSRGKSPEPIGQPSRAISAPVAVTKEHITPELHENPVVHSEIENDIRFCTTLHQIPSLKNLKISEIVAGEKHTLARTQEGRVLGWGANGYGQLGLGASLSFASIPVPTEVPLARVYPKATRLNCLQLAAGGNLSYFVVEKEDIQDGRKTIDLLASGNGQFGGIGNGSWAHAPSPIRVKTISGLLEWSDKTQSIEPIPIRSVSVGARHIAIVLDNAVEQPGGLAFGRDVFVWGLNEHFQLGTGKRNSLSTPQHLPPLPYPGLSAPEVSALDALPGSGTLSPMPHKRLQLAPEIKYKGRRVEETIIAGVSASAVYWRVIEP